MNFNKHLELDGLHAFLGASQSSWVNYDEDHLERSYRNMQAKQKGTKIHEFARQCIDLGVKLPKSNKTLNLYVNDAIGFKMIPEQPLFYSPNCFGTADAISFRKKILRIHDLKTGTTPAKMRQLEVYSALFCLEYDVNPNDIQMELRIYQFDTISIHEPQPEDVMYIMDKIVTFDSIIERMKEEE